MSQQPPEDRAEDAPARPGRWVGTDWVEGEPPVTVAPITSQVQAQLAGDAAENASANLHLKGIQMPFRWEVSAYGAIFATALLMRLWDLGSRAVHHDESLHGYFSWQVFSGNGYLHNPLTHGMFLFHMNAAGFFLFGDNDFTLRVPQALFGSVLVLMPWLLRPRLGTLGALAASLMLAFSPAMLYFSRFAREDIYMAVWVFGIIAMVWRYLDEGKHRFLYGAAAMLAFAFATKETTYIAAAIMGVSLLAMGWTDVTQWIWGRTPIKEWKRPAQALLVIGGLSLPMFAAGIGVFQDFLKITLAAQDNTPGIATGAPENSAYPIAFVIVVALIVASFALGLMWRKKVWLAAAGVFWAIFILLYSNFLTHPGGVGTGIWQSLGYWLGQHEVRRGNQPWYYYFILTHLYEFLPWTIAVGTVLYYGITKTSAFRWMLLAWGVAAIILAAALRDNPSFVWLGMGLLLVGAVPFMPADRFLRFLVFWSAATFLGFTLAGEKMPWLLVHVTLPLIILSARVLNDVANRVQWRKAWQAGGWLAIPGVPLFIVLIYRLTLYDRWKDSFWLLWITLAGAGLLLLGLHALSRKTGWKPALGLTVVVLAGMMFVLTMRASFVATYQYSDVAREMLVYTQTSPALHSLVKEIEQAGLLTGDREKIKLSIDSTSGFTWPWAWYLRGYTDVVYSDYSLPTTKAPLDAKVVVIHRNNIAGQQALLAEGFTEGRKLPHRWWFDERYRNLTAQKFFGTVARPREWDKFMDFFLYRKYSDPIGSEDAYVYFNKTLPLQPFE